MIRTVRIKQGNLHYYIPYETKSLEEIRKLRGEDKHSTSPQDTNTLAAIMKQWNCLTAENENPAP